MCTDSLDIIHSIVAIVIDGVAVTISLCAIGEIFQDGRWQICFIQMFSGSRVEGVLWSQDMIFRIQTGIYASMDLIFLL